MQERFKKNKSEWMEDFLKAVSSRNILKQSLDPPDPSKPNEPLFTSRIFKQYTFETKVYQTKLRELKGLLDLQNWFSPRILTLYQQLLTNRHVHAEQFKHLYCLIRQILPSHDSRNFLPRTAKT